MSIFNKIIDLQKLEMAWKKVSKNKPASGVDNVSYEDFELNKKAYLKQLNIELKEHSYRTLPVKILTIYKGQKSREVALYSMRDKVVQQSVAMELNRLYEGEFSQSACAYRSGKSALHVLQTLEEYLVIHRDVFYLKMDIVQFFDRIDQDILLKILREKIYEEDVLDLLREDWSAQSLSQDGMLLKKDRGIYQGSGISPVLSNIYLKEFDLEMEKRCEFYVRYSDGMLVIGNEKNDLERIQTYVETFLEGCGLELKQEKTQLAKVAEGFEFLGHKFDGEGKSIPAKAEEQLRERLEVMWMEQIHMPVEEKLKKGAEILGGWEQYFREERMVGSMVEYAVAVYMTHNRDHEHFQKLQQERKRLKNDFADIHRYLVGIWRKYKHLELELFEYEEMHLLNEFEEPVEIEESSPYLQQLIECYREMEVLEKEEHYTNLIQLYSDMACYQKASALTEEYHDFQNKADNQVSTAVSLSAIFQEEVVLDENQLTDYMQLFIGREDLYSEQTLQTRGRWCYQPVLEPLTEKIVKKHLKGTSTISTYVQRANSTVKFLVMDVDICKSVLLQWGSETPEFAMHLEEAGKYAVQIQGEMRKLGLTSYIEESGYRGFHVWVFFSEWIGTRYVNLLADVIEERIRRYQKESLTVEFFPNKARVRPNKFGQAIRMPLGIHGKNGKRSRFLEEDFTPVNDYGVFLESVAKYSCAAIKRILGTCSRKPVSIHESMTVDEEISEFGNLSSVVQVVLEKCTLLRYLCQKARKTGYLSHYERLTILYVFAHMGEEGKEFVHTVMKFTLNYQYQITERFIQKLPEKSISCIKLREQYKQITAEYGCSCSFQRTKNCYPSPVLHAIKSAESPEDSNITMPTSKTLTKDKEKSVYEEINVHKKAQELAEQILEMKRQKRRIDKSIQNTERELEKVFDSAQTDCMEIEMGLLTRRKGAKEYEWLIEI